MWEDVNSDELLLRDYILYVTTSCWSQFSNLDLPKTDGMYLVAWYKIPRLLSRNPRMFTAFRNTTTDIRFLQMQVILTRYELFSYENAMMWLW